MQITVRPDPECIELICSEFTDIALSFLRSLGVPEKESDNWESTHLVEITGNSPPAVTIFEMNCYLPEVLFEKSDWVYRIFRNNLFDLFIIANEVVCFRLLNTDGLKQLSGNFSSLSCSDYSAIGAINDISNELKNLHALRNISFDKCSSLTDISPLSGLNNLQSLDLYRCRSLIDISPLSALNKLQSLNLSNCESLTDISPLCSLTQLQHLDLGFCESLTDIIPVSF